MLNQRQPPDRRNSETSQSVSEPSGVGATSLVQTIPPSTANGEAAALADGERVREDGAEVQAEMARAVTLERMLRAVSGRNSDGESSRQGRSAAAASSSSGSPSASPSSDGAQRETLEEELERQLAGLNQAMARMGTHIEAMKRAMPGGPGPSAVPPPAPDINDENAMPRLMASLDRLGESLRQMRADVSPVLMERAPAPGVRDRMPLARGSVILPLADLDSEEDEDAEEIPLAQAPRQRTRITAAEPAVEPAPEREPAPLGPQPAPRRNQTVRPPRLPAPTRPVPPPPLQEAAPTGREGPPPGREARQPGRQPGNEPEPDPNPAAVGADPAPNLKEFEGKKQLFKAASYAGAALGTAASFAGWIAFNWVTQKVQQTSQAAGGLTKNLVGAAGDYYDSKDKERNGKPIDGFTAKIVGQVVSALGQATTIVGILVPGAGPARAVGAGVNALGMLAVAYGEGKQGNTYKAATNYAGAFCNIVGAVGYSLGSTSSKEKVIKDVAEAFMDVGSDANAWTPLGGAVDDSRNSKAAGATSFEKFKNDAKPRGQAVQGFGAWLNFVAAVLAKRSESVLAEDPQHAANLKLAAVVLGAIANSISTLGNVDTMRGEYHPRVAAAAPARADLEAAPPVDEDTNAIELHDRTRMPV